MNRLKNIAVETEEDKQKVWESDIQRFYLTGVEIEYDWLRKINISKTYWGKKRVIVTKKEIEKYK